MHLGLCLWSALLASLSHTHGQHADSRLLPALLASTTTIWKVSSCNCPSHPKLYPSWHNCSFANHNGPMHSQALSCRGPPSRHHAAFTASASPASWPPPWLPSAAQKGRSERLARCKSSGSTAKHCQDLQARGFEPREHRWMEVVLVQGPVLGHPVQRHPLAADARLLQLAIGGIADAAARSTLLLAHHRWHCGRLSHVR